MEYQWIEYYSIGVCLCVLGNPQSARAFLLSNVTRQLQCGPMREQHHKVGMITQFEMHEQPQNNVQQLATRKLAIKGR